MNDKFTRAHNRMAMATGETKTRTKLSKSKHGWIKIAMGITFASTSLFLMSAPTFADETTPTTTNQTATVAQPEAQNADQNNNTQADQTATPKQTDNSVMTLAAQPQNQAATDDTTKADTQTTPQTGDTDKSATDNAATTTTSQAAAATQLTAQSGTYTANQQQAIRDGASLESNVVNTLDPGESVNYDGTVNNEGYDWLHYISYSGEPHYVARLNDDAPASTSYISPDHQAFINQLAPGAQDTWNEYGVLPSVSMAQAIVESAWGQSAPGNNLYGIKGDYNGNSTLQTTQEYYNGHYVTIQDKFRAYPDLATSIEDHGRFLAVNSRYANLLYSQDYNYVCQMLQADGYATDPNYANTLTSIISYNNLNRFDTTLGQPTQPVENNTDNNDTSASATDNNQAANTSDNSAPIDNVNTNTSATNDGVQITPASGAYTANQSQPVRTGASTTASVAATLDPGDTIYYDGTANNDGYNWMHYISYSGEAHWVADVNAVKQDQPAPAVNNDVPTQTPSADSAITPASGAYTANQSQAVRIGASTDAASVATLDPGDTIYYDGTLNNDGYNWFHYISYSGDAHWVADLNDVQPTAPSTDSAITPASGAYTANQSQAVRTGASTDASVAATLDPGDTIYYDGTAQADGYNWFHYISYSGDAHWVADLNDAQPTAPSTDSAITPASGAYTADQSQAVRTGASTSASVAATLDPGDTIYYDGTAQADGYTWFHYISYSGEAHWVADLNDAQPTAPSTDSAITPASGAYTADQSQAVRTGASTSASVAATLDPGDTIYYDGTAQADGYTWFHYISYSGEAHWVANLNDAQPTAPSDTDGMVPASGAYTTPVSQNVHDEAGLDSNIALVLDAGYTVYFDGTKQADGYTWLHYTSYSGQSRWIAKLNLAF